MAERGSIALPEDCLEKIAAGDSEMFARLYTLTNAAVYGFALSILKNVQDAQDVAHDTYVHIWNNAAQYRKGTPMAWIFTMVRNLSLDALRRRRDHIPWEDAEAVLQETAAVTVEDRMLIRSLMRALSETERQVILLHAMAGLKHREIAKILDIPLATALSRYARAVTKLKENWKEAEGDA